MARGANTRQRAPAPTQLWAPQPGRPHAFLEIEIVNLPSLTALFGEGCGQELRRGAAARLAGAVPRLGGHWAAEPGRFCVSVPGLRATGLARLADQLHGALTAVPVATEAGPLALAPAIGGAAAPDGDAARLGWAAGRALAEAVADGGGVRLIGAAEDEIGPLLEAERAAAAAAISAAQGGMSLSYRPVMRSGARAASFHLAAPEIPGAATGIAGIADAAARLGLAPQLDRAVLRAALQALAASPRIRLAVSLAGPTLGDPGWAGDLAASSAADPDLAERLILRLPAAPPATLLRFAAKIRPLGPALALTSGGALPLSLGDLDSLRPDMLLLPRQHRGCGPLAGACRQALQAQIALAEAFEMMSVAVDVADLAEARALARMGIDYHTLPQLPRPLSAVPRPLFAPVA